MIKLTFIVSALLLFVMISASKTTARNNKVRTEKNPLVNIEIKNNTEVRPSILFLISDDKNVDASLWWNYEAKPGC